MLSLGQMLPDLAQPMAAKDQEDEGCGEQHGGTELPPRGPLLGSWHQDVNLACKSCPEEGASRAWTTFYYNLLQSCLQQAGLPETGDRSLEPRPGCPGAEVTMCILGSPSSFFSVLRGGAQSPGNSLLCLSPSWLSKVPVAGEPGDSALLVSKAVASPGGPFLPEEFAPRRRVTYFLGELGFQAGRGREVAELSRGLGCPAGGPAELARLLEDRLLVRQLLAQSDKVAVPATLALTYKPPPQLRGCVRAQSLWRVELSDKEGQWALVEEEVETFLRLGALGEARQVAVKPGGWRWRGSRAMSLHPRSEPGAVVRAVMALLEKLEEEESLVEAVCPPAHVLQPDAPPGSSLPSQPELAIRACAVVCRTQGDRPLMSQVVCSVGRPEQPLRHQVALTQSLETALAACGPASEPAAVEALRGRVREAAGSCARSRVDFEASLSPEQRGGRQAQTDVLGVDLALTRGPGGAPSPVLLELNSCLSEACGLLEGQWSRRGLRAQWAAAGPLVETMLRRSARHLMEGKLLVVGAGGYSKKFVWEAARDYGLKLHPVESDPNFAPQLVQTFIHFDVTEHRRDEENARHLAELVRARGQLTASFSYWDDCLVLTALLCEAARAGCPPAAMSLAKQKSRKSHLLRCRSPRRPPSVYALAAGCPPEGPEDVERAACVVPLPGMKLEFGAGAVGVRLVEDASQCRAHFAKISRDLQGADHPGIGLGWGNAMLLMEFVAGTEHDVDLVLLSGLLGALWPRQPMAPRASPGFTETAACMPTGLAPEREAPIQAAYQCCLLRLLDGVFNVEMRPRRGPRLIEINPRMGGFYRRDWIQELYGVDLLLAAAMVACGIPPALPARPGGRGSLVGGVMCVVLCLRALSSTASREALQALHERGLIRLNLLEEELVPGEYESPSAGLRGSSPAEARQRLLGLCQGGIDSPNYPVAHFPSHFK
ncbi:LOW QUALITY PROTEIN: carnosine synthase 1 [Sarcophilus harrisii]